MADIADILGSLETVQSNVNNTSFIEMMKNIAGDPSDDIETPDDPNSLYGSMLLMYNEMVGNRASDVEIAEALQKVLDLTASAESVTSTESASATLIGSNIHIKVPSGVDGIDGVDALSPVIAISETAGVLEYEVTGYTDTPVAGVKTSIVDLDAIVDDVVGTNINVVAVNDSINTFTGTTVQDAAILIENAGDAEVVAITDHAVATTAEYDANHVVKIGEVQSVVNQVSGSVQLAIDKAAESVQFAEIAEEYAIDTQEDRDVVALDAIEVRAHQLDVTNKTNLVYGYLEEARLIDEDLNNVSDAIHKLIIEVPTYADLPTIGTSGTVYIVALDEILNRGDTAYRWNSEYVKYVPVTDQLSDGEIKTAYENNVDTNVFDDAAQAKLASTETNVATNLSNTASETEVTIESSDGTNTSVVAANAAQAGVMTKDMFDKLDGIEAAADVTDTANVDSAGAVMESDYDANTMMIATSDDTPIASTPTQVRAFVNVEDGATADQTGTEMLIALSGVAGTGSGLDADLLDGQQGSYYGTAAAVALNTAKVTNVRTDLTQVVTENDVTIESSDGTDVTIIAASAAAAGVMTKANWDKLNGIETGATADQTASEVETLYEGIADTNKYTDSEKSIVDVNTGLTTTATTLPTAVNEHEGKLEAIHQRHLDVGEPTGFINKNPLSRGKMELCTDGTVIHGIDYDGSYYTNTSGKFALGTIYEENATERTHAIFPADGQPTYDFYVQGHKYEHTVLDKIQVPETAGRKAIYFDDAGVIQYTDTPNAETFRDYAVVSVVYGNPGTGTKVVHADERHGCGMSGDTHYWLHRNAGTQYNGGLGINGLVAGSTAYTSIDSGEIQDEDLVKAIGVQLNTPFWYIDTDAWRSINDGLDLSYTTVTRPNYSLDNGDGTFTLTEMGNNNYMIMHFMATNDGEFPVVKVLGQNEYNSVADAQAAIKTEASTLTLGTLPSPEFKFLYSVIVDDTGGLRLLSDGSTILDLRNTIITGTGNVSGVTSSHPDILNRDALDSHPISAITGLTTELAINVVKDITLNAVTNEVTITYKDGTTAIRDFNDVVTDIFVNGATLDATTNVLTLSAADGGADVTVDLSDFVNSGELVDILSIYYTKTATDLLLVDKANQSTTYTMDEVDAIADTKVAISDVLGAIGNISSPLLDLPLKNSLAMTKGVGSVDFTRASTATYIDRYGVLQYASIDEPRFEKDGLLIEGASTNLVLNSSDTTLWNTNTRVTYSTDTTLSPDGVSLATKITGDGTSGEHKAHVAVSIATPATRTGSVFVKYADIDTVSVQTYVSGGVDGVVLLVTNFTFSTKTSSDASWTVDELDNGWFRLSKAITSTDQTGAHVRVYTGAGATNTSTDSVYVAFAQIEELPFASSYIPTTSSAVTRSADICNVDYSNNTPSINQDQSILIDFELFGHIDGYQQTIFQSFGDNYTRIYKDASDTGLFYTAIGAGYGVAEEYNTISKYAMSADDTTFSLYKNGELVGSSTRALPYVSAGTTIKLGYGFTTDFMYGHVKNFRIYDKVLSATEIAIA